MIAEIKKKEILNYCEKNSVQDSQNLKDLIEYTYKNEPAPQMISGLQVGNFLQSLVMATNAKKILEIGTFTGYSALKMAEVLPKDGTIDTCELGENHVKTAKYFFSKSKHGKKIKIHTGPALETIKAFEPNTFDLCFIDADKNNYKNYYIECIKLIKNGASLVIDNMLWGGSVLNPKDKETKTIAETAKIINADKTVHNTMLTIRDGLMLCIKK
tara:strand:- start:53502 stop:54143 length:642 start_codon:yes stop_codon:yes gene_type:complete